MSALAEGAARAPVEHRDFASAVQVARRARKCAVCPFCISAYRSQPPIVADSLCALLPARPGHNSQSLMQGIVLACTELALPHAYVYAWVL